MEQTGDKNMDGLYQRIGEHLASGQAVLLHGPACCGKTAICLDIYRNASMEMTRPGCDFIVPNSATASFITRELLAGSAGGVLVSPRVGTFAALAGRILTAAGDVSRPISPFQRHLLLRNIVDELVKAGELSVIHNVADTPGLIITLDRAIAELKRAAVEVHDLARAVETSKSGGQSRDLLAVYRRYQEHLSQARLFDVEGQMWLAREHVRNTADVPIDLVGLAGTKLLIVDGFTDFTPTQLEILALLNQRGLGLLITLPTPVGDDGRNRMWLWTERTRNRLRKALGQRLTEIAVSDPPSMTSTVSRDIAKIAFQPDSSPVSPPEGLAIIATAGIEAEVSAMARRIKKLLMDETRSPGNGQVKIALLARSLETYRPTVERIFAENDIPIAASAQILTDVPIIKFCLTVGSMAKDNFEFHSVLRVIGNSYFQPESLGPFTAEHIAAADMIIRCGNVLAGREAYDKALQRRLLQIDNLQTSDDFDEQTTVEHASRDVLIRAGEMLQKLFDIAESARTPAGLAMLRETLMLDQAAMISQQPDLVARDIRALNALIGAVGQVTDNAMSIELLRESLSQISLPSPRREILVDVFDVLDARAMRWDHVFLMGLSESQFPQHVAETSLLNEADRKAWAGLGAELDCRSDLNAREMLLFYLAVSRAMQTMTMSFLHSDAGGKASAAGSFLMTVIENLGGFEQLAELGLYEKIPAGRFVLPCDQIASIDNATLAAVGGLFDESTKPELPALAWLREYHPDRLGRISNGIWTARRRWQVGTCNEFDGLLSSNDLKKDLAERFPGRTVFSATRLSTYGKCPWRFFAKYLLKLEPIIKPERQLEAVSKGIFCHNVLWKTMTDLAERFGRPLSLQQISEDEIQAAFDRAFAAEVSRVELTRPAWPVLWEIQRDGMKRQLAEYLLGQRNDNPLSFKCLNFELAFGEGEARPGELADPASIAEPVTINLVASSEKDSAAGPKSIRLQGRIDRIDFVDTEHGAGLMVVDYKTGSLPKFTDNIDGQNTQMPLYIAVAEQLLNAQALGGAFHGIGGDGKQSFFAGVKLWAGKIIEAKDFSAQREEALAAVGRFVTGMAGGDFSLQPKTDACKWCPYRQSCQFSPARAEIKAPQGGQP